MGTCYYLVEPVGQTYLDVDKAGWLFSVEPALPAPFSVEDLQAVQIACDDYLGNDCDCGRDVLHGWRRDVIVKWMREHLEGRSVYILGDTWGECFPPLGLHSWHDYAGDYPWGEDSRSEGWTEFDIFELAADQGAGE